MFAFYDKKFTFREEIIFLTQMKLVKTYVLTANRF